MDGWMFKFELKTLFYSCLLILNINTLLMFNDDDDDKASGEKSVFCLENSRKKKHVRKNIRFNHENDVCHRCQRLTNQL